jgi:hypothetical protein
MRRASRIFSGSWFSFYVPFKRIYHAHPYAKIRFNNALAGDQLTARLFPNKKKRKFERKPKKCGPWHNNLSKRVADFITNFKNQIHEEEFSFVRHRWFYVAGIMQEQQFGIR